MICFILPIDISQKILFLRRHIYIINDFPTNVKEKLNSIISDMADHHWLFSNNPGHDFMRQDLGKLSFYDTFTDKYTNIMKDQSDVYRYMNPNKNIPHFQQLLDKKHLYFMQFRVVKIKVAENTYEYMITNLPHTFDLEDIKACYHWRWGIEVSFRYLKHANGLLYFHSKKPEFLKQEIYANLILYNFGIFLANEAAEENKKGNGKKTINITTKLTFHQH